MDTLLFVCWLDVYVPQDSVSLMAAGAEKMGIK